MQIGASLGWRDPLYLAAKPGQERVHRFVAMLLMLQRASYILPSAAGVFSYHSPYFSRMQNIALLGLTVLWNVILIRSIRRTGWFDSWTIVVDVVVSCVLIVMVTANCPLEDRLTSSVNWSSSVLLASGALLGATMPARLLAIGLLPPALSYVVAHFEDLGTERHWLIDTLTRLNSYVWFAVILLFIARYLRGQAKRLEDLTQQRLSAETQQARHTERLAQYRRLHDTVLTTLTAIARGGLDHNADQVRRRCAADAEYVRLLITADPAGSDLAERLAEVAAGATDLGLRIRYSAEPVSASLPCNVVMAMSEACREALNNVALHSGTTDAWLTVIDDDGVVTVRVVDRGAGFSPDATTAGFGLRESIVERMREVGGHADIFSLPGDGTCVDLTWPGPRGEAAWGPHEGTARSA